MTSRAVLAARYDHDLRPRRSTALDTKGDRGFWRAPSGALAPLFAVTSGTSRSVGPKICRSFDARSIQTADAWMLMTIATKTVERGGRKVSGPKRPENLISHRPWV